MRLSCTRHEVNRLSGLKELTGFEIDEQRQDRSSHWPCGGRGIRGPKMGGNIECELVDLEDNLLGFPRDSQAFTYFDQAWT